MKLFCLHHAPAIERKIKLLNDFDHHGLDVEWIEKFDPQSYNRADYDVRHPLNDAELSLYLKQRYALELQKSNGYEHVIIMEDDVILPYDWNIKEYFTKCLIEFDEMQGDILNIGGAFNMRPSKIYPDKLVYHEPHFTTRCAHCYSISDRCLDKILLDSYTIDDAWDWKLNNCITKYGLKSCYVEPSVEQSSLGGNSLLR